MARQTSRGVCHLCQGTFPKGSMTRHLAKCLLADEDPTKPPQPKSHKGRLLHLVVEGKYNPQYWLHLEVPATTRLGYLDQFLRHIWLECCDHLSAFKLQRPKRPPGYSLAAMLAAGAMDWRDPDEVSMESRVSALFDKGLKVSYEYDFGSTTHLALKMVAEREGWVEDPNEIRLLARNDPPHIPCGRCDTGEAILIDAESSYDESGWMCAKCAKKAGLEDTEMAMPVVNSPRTGVCGYTGL